jgi:hypothetical protein
MSAEALFFALLKQIGGNLKMHKTGSCEIAAENIRIGRVARVTTAEYPLRQSSPAIKNWLALPRVLFSFAIFIGVVPE